MSWRRSIVSPAPTCRRTISPDSVKAVDDLTVEVTLLNPTASSRTWCRRTTRRPSITPADYELGTLFDQRPDGTGAFILDTYDVATGATYKPNEDWWGGVPYLDGLEILFSDDNATQINGLLGDQADAVIQFAVSDADALFNSDQVTVESIQRRRPPPDLVQRPRGHVQW